MIVIIDTHVLIWSHADPRRLSPVVFAYLADPANRCFISVVNVWEIVIKAGQGKLPVLQTDIRTLVAEQRRVNRLDILPVTYDHALALEGLPPAHRDPFDRLLAAQAVAENAVLLTSDAIFRQYPVRTAW